MSGLHADRGWLLLSLQVPTPDGEPRRWRHYLKLRDTRENRRRAAKLVKEIESLASAGRWAEVARRFSHDAALAPFRPTESAEPTLRDVIDRFLRHQEASNAPGTVAYYRELFRGLQVAFPCETHRVSKVTPAQIMGVLGALKAKGYAARANKLRGALSTLFTFAIREGIAAHNPVRHTKPLRVRREADEVNPFSALEVSRIIGAARDGWERRLVTVALGTGLRPAELFGLKRADVDLGAHVLYVRRNLSRFGEGDVKTARSRRTIDLAEPVEAALRAQMAEVELRSEWLWPDTYHRRIRPHSAHNFSRRNWPAILKRAGVAHREFYQCRHTYAVNLLTAGADWMYVKEQMGHGSLAMLQRHYWHLRPGKAKGPARADMGRALGLGGGRTA